ncbi:hypothetical protein [Streptococcus hyointestinalis]|uniref:hypothetical protein n=1 Tax=Streptococcus hyointestinalis TaxID=1337 RepID=UPI0013DF9FB7|nr:hypothetical protein [Streptococcus hyointestinalis]
MMTWDSIDTPKNKGASPQCHKKNSLFTHLIGLSSCKNIVTVVTVIVAQKDTLFNAFMGIMKGH